MPWPVADSLETAKTTENFRKQRLRHTSVAMSVYEKLSDDGNLSKLERAGADVQ